MKIKIKRTIEDTITIPNISKEGDPYFNDVVKHIFGLKFLEVSCQHDSISSLFGKSQGGSNSYSITQIELLESLYGKQTFKLSWNESEFTYLIAKDA